MKDGHPTPGARQGVTLLMLCTLAVMGTAIIAPVIPLMITDFREFPNAAFWAPFAVTVPSLCVALVGPAAGLLADRYGRRLLLIAALVAYGVVGVLPAFLTSLPGIIVSRVALGVFEAIIMTVSTTLIGDYFSGRERDTWLGYQTAVASITAVVLLALGGFMGERGWRLPFFMYLAALPMAALVFMFTWEPAASRESRTPDVSTWRGFPWRALTGICALTLLAGMMFYVVQIEMSVALGELGMTTPSRVGLLTAAVSIGIPVGTLVFKRISYWRIERLLCLEFGAMAIGFIGMSHSPTLAVFVAFVVVNQIGGGMMLPTMLTWALRQLDFHQRGRGTGIWQSVFALGPPLGPGLVTYESIAGGTGIVPTFQTLGWLALPVAIGAGVIALRRK